jgi:hypothetical protein
LGKIHTWKLEFRPNPKSFKRTIPFIRIFNY